MIACVVLNLVPLSVKSPFEPHPSNEILVPFIECFLKTSDKSPLPGGPLIAKKYRTCNQNWIKICLHVVNHWSKEVEVRIY